MLKDLVNKYKGIDSVESVDRPLSTATLTLPSSTEGAASPVVPLTLTDTSSEASRPPMNRRYSAPTTLTEVDRGLAIEKKDRPSSESPIRPVSTPIGVNTTTPFANMVASSTTSPLPSQSTPSTPLGSKENNLTLPDSQQQPILKQGNKSIDDNEFDTGHLVFILFDYLQSLDVKN